MIAVERDALRAAYRAGKRSSKTNVDADVAVDRYLQKNATPGVAYALLTAWYDGFEWDCRDEQPPFMWRCFDASTTWTRSDSQWQRVK